jgi:glycosyltransferase involved in cell wall biosynthesis
LRFSGGPNGRDSHDFPPGAKSDLILSAGRLWDESKNVGRLVEIAPRLPWPVCIAGESVDPTGARVHFESVRMLGRLTPGTLARWYSSASIYALPARYEPFGLSALEAALAGCALVLGDIDSLREIWDDTALYVSPDDSAALEAAIRALIDAPERRAALAERGRARALGFTPKRMVEGYVAAYRDLVAQRSRGHPGSQPLVRDPVHSLEG